MDENRVPKTFDLRYPVCRNFEIFDNISSDDDIARIYLWASVFEWARVEGNLDELREQYNSLELANPGVNWLLSEKYLGYRMDRQ